MDSTEVEDPWTPFARAPTIRSTLLGKRRASRTVDRYEWMFLGIVSFALSIVFGITLYRIFELPTTTSEFTLAILVLINICCCYVYAYHGVFFEQPYELGILVISTVIILVYSSLSYDVGEVQDSLKTGKFLYTCFIVPFIVILGGLKGYHYKISGNLVFRIVGGDPFMQTICRRAQLQCTLLFFDAQAIFSCIILIIHTVGISLMQELLILILGIIFTLIWTLIGYFTVRFENAIFMALFFILSTAQPSYVVWRLVSAKSYQPDPLQLAIVNASGVIFLLIHCYLIINTFRVYQNFGKGLKEKIFGVQQPTSQYGAVEQT